MKDIKHELKKEMADTLQEYAIRRNSNAIPITDETLLHEDCGMDSLDVMETIMYFENLTGEKVSPSFKAIRTFKDLYTLFQL